MHTNLNTEKLSVALVESHVKTLLKSFKAKNPMPEKALRILFEHNLFGECIKEIKDAMHIPCTLKIAYREDKSFPEKNAAAFIKIPSTLPMYGSKDFENISLEIWIRKSTTKDYNLFVSSVAHEISHIVLHSTRHPLRHSEIATDLFVILSGFGEIMKPQIGKAGYLDNFHFYYAQNSIKGIVSKPEPKKANWSEKITSFIKKLF